MIRRLPQHDSAGRTLERVRIVNRSRALRAVHRRSFCGPGVDAGVSWRSIDGDAALSALPDIPVHSIAIDPTRAGRLFLGTDLGVFVSVDDGAHWAVENTGFPPAVTETLVLNGSGNETSLFAFTHGRGVWKVRLGVMSRQRAIRR